MSRGLSADMIAAIEAPDTRPILMFEGQFTNGWVQFWTGIGPLDWNDKTWTGAGDLLAISEMEETDDVKANGVTVTLSGIGSENIALALLEMQRNAPGAIYFGLLTIEGLIIPDPKTIFRGRLDVCAINDGADTVTLSVTYESELILLQSPKTVRYTDQEQKRLYPDDRGLEFVASMADKTIHWGAR